MNFFVLIRRGAVKVGHTAVKIAAPALDVAAIVLPELAPVVKLLDVVTPKSNEGDNLVNPLEMMAITMMMGVLQTTVKNPAHAAALKGQLVGIAEQIFMAYGMPLPVDPATQIAAPVAAPVAAQIPGH